MRNLDRYENSTKFLSEAELIIPLGSQTFSKSHTQYPRGISPLYAQGAKGAKIWDIDGNEYVDLVNSLAAITVGYRNRTVERAVLKQLRRGTIYSLPGKLEFQVAEKICHLVPSSEKVRFAKNGTDATSAAIRLARAYTSRDHVAVCGYHGWQDWSIGTTTRNKGVPDQVSSLSHTFQYNSCESLESLFKKFPDQIAAVIMEPMTGDFPQHEFLESVQELTKANGAVLIFDETITGFRFSEGGAQELFNVVPDITTLGKGMANGYPLSAVVGNSEIMKEMEEIFFSGTFGGELLSLAAADAVLDMHLDRAVVPELSQVGLDISDMVQELILDYGLNEVLELKGHSSWKILSWTKAETYSINQIKTLFLQEMFAMGVLIIGSHNVSTAFGSKEIVKVRRAYDHTFNIISRGLREGDLEKYLKVEPAEPLFKVR
jgi:glutamate-1-semialdehyde 2,1-aminomutase